ncbi:MAG: transcriptional repressor NrdR [Acidobacteria bacterium]|nr:transcriptional repressor NrdR [Acidobacteriota bacterium]
MRCPFCGHPEDKVVDSREVASGDTIRRRRECLACHKRFTSYEHIETIPYRVVKKDGRREKFDRGKLINGVLKACEKRPVSMASVEALVNEVEGLLHKAPDGEISTSDIGNHVMERLKELDKVAFVRFASVYRQFGDISEFLEEVKRLADPHRQGGG